MRLEGIHHISAITGDARGNVDFYTRVMGLRLVAKTVNQDDPSVYHLFYADENGRPGAELTFFEYPNAVRGRPGPGMVHTIAWRVAGPAALDFWTRRLEAEGVASARDGERLTFSDPEGLIHELGLDDSPDAPLIADHPDIPAEHALRGFAGVRAYDRSPGRSAPLLERVLGAQARDGDTWELRGESRGGWIAYEAAPAGTMGRQGAGSVHHVAWGTTAAEHAKWEDRLRAAGVATSGLVDRYYFQSIYFREPSGVLFEIADDAPGFTVDGPLEELGRRIILPPRLEPARERIEAILTPLPDPRADRVAS